MNHHRTPPPNCQPPFAGPEDRGPARSMAVPAAAIGPMPPGVAAEAVRALEVVIRMADRKPYLLPYVVDVLEDYLAGPEDRRREAPKVLPFRLAGEPVRAGRPSA